MSSTCWPVLWCRVWRISGSRFSVVSLTVVIVGSEGLLWRGSGVWRITPRRDKRPFIPRAWFELQSFEFQSRRSLSPSV